MKFKLSTLFVLTAIVGVWLLLARLNPWLPVVLAVMFGPATLAFAWWRSRIVLLANILPLTVWCALPFLELDTWQGDPTDVRKQTVVVDEDGAIFWFADRNWTRQDAWIRSMDWYDAGSDDSSFQEHFICYRLRGLRFGWRVLIVMPLLYGVALHLLARWLDRRRAKT